MSVTFSARLQQDATGNHYVVLEGTSGKPLEQWNRYFDLYIWVTPPERATDEFKFAVFNLPDRAPIIGATSDPKMNGVKATITPGTTENPFPMYFRVNFAGQLSLHVFGVETLADGTIYATYTVSWTFGNAQV